MIKKIILFTLGFILSNHLSAQDNYKGDFSNINFYIKTDRNIPVGNHVGFDEDEGITIAIYYGQEASIKDIAVKINKDTICFAEVNFP